jgi:hypothetical protein
VSRRCSRVSLSNLGLQITTITAKIHPEIQLIVPSGQVMSTDREMAWRAVMSINEIKEILLWCAVLNYAILFIWFAVFVFAHDWMYKLHHRWFKIPAETFDSIHYAGFAFYKLGIILLNVAPLVSLFLVY